MLHEAELHSTLYIMMVLIIDHFKEKKKQKEKKCPIFFARTRKSALPSTPLP